MVSAAAASRARAREALGAALGLLAPEAIALRDGSLRLSHSSERLAGKTLRRLERRLTRRAAGSADTDDRLVGEAVAFLGAELSRARGGSPADGATAALDTLLDLPSLPELRRAEAEVLLENVLGGNPLTTDADLQRLTNARGRRPGTHRPYTADLLATAHSLAREGVRAADRIPVPTPAPIRDTELPSESSSPRFGSRRQAYRAARERRAEEQYAQFRELSREWHEVRAGLPGRQVAAIEQELASLSRAIRRGGHPAPSLPGADQVHPTSQEQTPVGAEAQDRVPSAAEARSHGRLGLLVGQLEAAAADHAQRAEVRTASAAAARGQAAGLFEEADRQGAMKDGAAGERARRLRVRAVARVRVAERHTEIAAACTTAAELARAAAAACQTGDQTAQGQNFGAVVEAIQAYERASAATLPAADLQHNGLPSGRLPHLSALCGQLNAALAQRKVAFQFTPDVLHRTLRGESRRMLSPDGIILTIGNDPRANVDKLVQIQLQLDVGELHEVLDSPLVFDEAQVGQVVQGGFSVTTASARNLGSSTDTSLRVLTNALPDDSKLKAAAAIVSPGIEVGAGRGRTVSGGATEYAQTGAVEALRGEFLRYRSTRPRWNWRIRESPTAEWSEPHVVDTGTDRDRTTLELGYIHTYTVPPPAETVDLKRLGLSAERNPRMPEGMATRVDGLEELCDQAVRELDRRLGSLDRVGHDRVRSLIVEDGTIRLDETTRPGGVWRLITNGGRPVAWAQLETVADIDAAELTSDSSPDHKLELWRVGNSGASGSQSFSKSRSIGVNATYAGTAMSNLGSTTADLSPGVRAGRSTSQQDAASTADLGSRWSTQRIAPTVGVKVPLRHKVTMHRLDRPESFSADGAGDAWLRLAEREAFRYGLPVPAAALVRDPNGEPKRGADGRLLLRGDPQPLEVPLRLPTWLGSGPGQLRGAGPAMIRELTGADEALRGFLQHLSDENLIPPLDADGNPVPSALAGEDPAVILSRTENWERACQQIAKHRLETGYDHAAQDRLTFQLTEHRTGYPPRIRSFQLNLEQHFDRATALGAADSDMVVNVDIGVSTSGRSGSQSQSLPWWAKLKLSNAPAAGQAGSTPNAGATVGRTSRGRTLGWSASRGAYRMTVAESSSPVAVFDIPHTITISELTSKGASVPIASSEGSAQVWLDSEFCARPEPAELALRGRVAPKVMDTATIHHVDARDPIKKLTEAIPDLRRGDSSALHHLSAFLAPRNLIGRPELLTSEYRTALAVGNAPSDPLETIRQRGFVPRQTTLNVTTRVENLRYVGSGQPILAELNLTLASTGSSSGTSSGVTGGVSGGSGSAAADGHSWAAALGLTRSKSVSSSESQTASTAVERTLMRDGRHYQFCGDLVLEAQLRSGGAAPQAIPLETGAVVLTLPERDALRSYGRRELDLPLHQVSDAVERMRNGNLVLPRRTTVALLRRYQSEQGRAHADEVLTNLAHEATGRSGQVFGPLDQRLNSALAEAEALARQRIEPQLPRHYERMLGRAQVDWASLQDQDGNDTDMFPEACIALAQHAPEALDDPVLLNALRGDLSGTRSRNTMDDMLDPRGFVREFPVQLGMTTRNVRVRVRLRFVGPPSTEPDGATGQSGNGFGLVQLWNSRDRSRSATEGTSYGGTLDISGTGGASVSGSAGAELGTSTTAASSEINFRINTGLAVATARVERDFELIIEVEDSAAPGGPPSDKRGVTRRVSTGRMSLAVAESVLDSVPPAPEIDAPDHRAPELPDGNYLVESTQPYRTGDAEENTLVTAAATLLGKKQALTAAGVQRHLTTLESALGAANRMVTFPEMVSESGYELVPMAIPDQTSRVVVTTVKAEVSGLELVSDPKEGATTQLGENTRQLLISQLTARSNKVLPGSRTVGGTTPGGEFSANVTASRMVSDQDTGTVGARHETGVYESGEVVTVKVDVAYHLTSERLRITRRNRPKLEWSETVPNAAAGETYLTMFRHEYDAMRAQMEADRAPERPAGRVRTVQVNVVGDQDHPYQPLVDALAQARRDHVNVRLTVRAPEGGRTTYVARPDGTMTSRGDGGFAAAFATLHPHLAVLAEGRVDLRALHAAGAGSRRFTGTVVDALQQHGIPASALAETDSRMGRSHTGEDTPKTPARRGHTANPANGMTI
ncbi:hypothetical protein [Kribbella solani]|uniref:Uncharacterized protein n=1 Tax=Kribbella solani TaxID=236067 RepID=A0A841DHI8_9ACTN|nr:hypothetical protein [Kribbella solani]MBB5978614.1 hypothetical protein [Kribbella solani]